VKARAIELLQRGATELGLSLAAKELDQFSSFAAELQKWNKKINLTALASDTDIAVKHFVDSLSLLKVVGREGALLDIGSGGGFPAIPLKIVCPGLTVVSVDAVAKKILFQRQVVRTLGLAEFTALHLRAEELATDYAGRFDWIVSRAFADLSLFARLALPLLGEQGRIVAMKGKGGKEEAESAQGNLTELGLRICELQEFPLPVTGDARCLVVLEKIAAGK
jgi:16S rRNA (guanine527-N7)-methyltransferase